MHWEPAPLLVELVERGIGIADWENEQRAKRAQS
jgi:3-hydroxyacyl-CoA dehydrogenase